MEIKEFEAVVEYPTMATHEISAISVQRALEKAIALDHSDDGDSDFRVDFDAVPHVSIKDEKGNVLAQNRPSYFDLARLVQNIVDHVSAAEDTNGQVTKLRELGFSDELLLHYGYSEEDLEDELEED